MCSCDMADKLNWRMKQRHSCQRSFPFCPFWVTLSTGHNQGVLSVNRSSTSGRQRCSHTWLQTAKTALTAASLQSSTEAGAIELQSATFKHSKQTRTAKLRPSSPLDQGGGSTVTRFALACSSRSMSTATVLATPGCTEDDSCTESTTL